MITYKALFLWFYRKFASIAFPILRFIIRDTERAFNIYLLSQFQKSETAAISSILRAPDSLLKQFSTALGITYIVRRLSDHKIGSRIMDRIETLNYYDTNHLLQLSLWLADHDRALKLLNIIRTEVSSVRKPDFILIGGMRCGTTWLREALSRHPDIWLPQYEPLYFSNNPLNWSWEEYVSIFLPGANISTIGEKSSNYTLSVDKIRSSLPDSKLILIIRNPFERLISHYNFARRRGYSISLEHFVEQNFENCLAMGKYADAVSSGADRMLTVLYEDIAHIPETVICSSLNFIGVTSRDIRSLNPDRAINKSYPSKSRKRWPDLLQEAGLVKMLTRYYSEDIEALSHLTHSDLSSWLDW